MLFERKYLLVRSTYNFHLYEWVDAPSGSKGWLKQLYVAKEEVGGEDPPAEIVIRGDVE